MSQVAKCSTIVAIGPTLPDADERARLRGGRDHCAASACIGNSTAGFGNKQRDWIARRKRHFQRGVESGVESGVATIRDSSQDTHLG